MSLEGCICEDHHKQTKEVMVDKQDRQRILEGLAELSGQQFQEDQIERRGTKIVIPEKLSPTQARDELDRYITSQEKTVSLIHRTNYRYLDGLVAVKRVLRRLSGFTQASRKIESFFGSFTPPAVNVQIGLNEYESCPQGVFPLEIFAAEVTTDYWVDEEKGMLFMLSVEAPRKYENAVKGFFTLIDEQLRENSIYRGQAITAEQEPTFLDLRGVDPDKVVYSEDVLTQLNANIWSLIEHTDAMRANELPLKRAALLEGPYGTGKTLAAYLTAQRAVENGWTFIFVRPGKDNLSEAMATAQLYQPAVVFFEDVDVAQDQGNNVSKLLDVFDGIQAKGTEIIAVLTTNHAEKIHKGLVRPGRLDAVIHIGELDATGVERMIRSSVEERWLPDDLDVEAIHAEMEGFMPAFVKEAIDRANRYTIAKNGGEPGPLTNQDFIDAATGLKPQLNLMNEASDEWHEEPVDAAIGRIVGRTLGNFELRRGPNGNTILVEKEEVSSAS